MGAHFVANNTLEVLLSMLEEHNCFVSNHVCFHSVNCFSTQAVKHTQKLTCVQIFFKKNFFFLKISIKEGGGVTALNDHMVQEPQFTGRI